MALSPNDPYRSVSPDDSTEALRQRARLDNELQSAPELADGEASGSRIGLYAIAVVAVLGVVFYGLNSSNPPKTDPVAQTSSSAPATSAAPPAPANTQAAAPTSPPGQTTGSAASSPSAPSVTAPAANDPAPASAPQANPTGQDAPQPGAASPSTSGSSNTNQ
jgi:hypothetical protein